MSLTRAPYKRKRRSKKNASLHEDDDDVVDTVTHVDIQVNTDTGPTTKRIKVPLIPIAEGHPTTQDNLHIPAEWDGQNPQLPEEPTRPHIGMVSISLSFTYKKRMFICT
jgi:hypothetical protein